MPDKIPNKAVAVYPDTYDALVKIMNQPHMLSKNGLTRGFAAVVAELTDFYLKAHQKGRK